MDWLQDKPSEKRDEEQTRKINELLGYSIEQKTVAARTEAKLERTEAKMDRIASNASNINRSGRFMIYRDNAALPSSYMYRAFCANANDYRALVKEHTGGDRERYTRIVGLKTPNANALWNKFKAAHGHNLTTRYHSFDLTEEYNELQLIHDVTSIHRARKNDPGAPVV